MTEQKILHKFCNHLIALDMDIFGLKKKLALDEEKWFTTENKKRILVDTESGEIKAGMGGKFNGVILPRATKDEPYLGLSDNKERFFHGSFEDTDTLTSKNRNEIQNGKFDGLFSVPEPDPPVGTHTYYTDIEKNDILDDDKIYELKYDDEGYEKLSDAVSKVTGIDKTDDNFETIFNALIDEDVDFSDLEADIWQDLTGEYDAAEISWELQNMRMNVAWKLGYKAVSMKDETGTSYALAPGLTALQLR